jgi:cell division protein FtsB
MAIPEYDSAAKWAAFFRSLPRRQKIIFGVIVVLILGIFLYFWFGPMRTLRNENAQLKTNLSDAQKEIVTARDKKDELHRENLHLQELIDPIRKKESRASLP